ncbi:hypothetical protein BJ138DRAFT_1206883 [Hygrophoropsis aurantiaca]|uniref:Uncharacterized protein n=1 Tax=Hygrophoropsis aurantiaca TaxID=72124 RepID=A0ACB8A546_9AGAM|nr:hypothetical protein BJ138DRAFT_1206883 [Hygrophoropsis aurantiaca]
MSLDTSPPIGEHHHTYSRLLCFFDVKRKLGHFADVPSTEEWARFESYTFRVREIQLYDEDIERLSHFMAGLSMEYLSRPSQHLFPNLQSLKWGSPEYTTQLPLAIPLFLPPSLRCLELDFDSDDSMEPGEVQAMLSLFEYQCIMLTQLRIRGLYPGSSGCGRLAAVLRALKSRSCQQLEILDCSLVNDSILSHLAQLPTLKDLSVELPAPISNTIASNKGFANLQTLRLEAWDIDIIISFLWSTQLSLDCLQIYLSPTSESKPLLSSPQQLFYCISNGLCHSSLTQIVIEIWWHPEPIDAILDITTLRPLLLFSKLEHLRLNIVCSIDLNDENLMELANAWPRLQTLVFNEKFGWQRTSGITFQGLASLLRVCPLLDTLALSIDATRLGFASSTRPGEEFCNGKITTIYLGDSIIDNPTAVASILQGLFPSLTAVAHCCAYRPDKTQYAPLWAEVNSHLAQTRK